MVRPEMYSAASPVPVDAHAAAIVAVLVVPLPMPFPRPVMLAVEALHHWPVPSGADPFHVFAAASKNWPVEFPAVDGAMMTRPPPGPVSPMAQAPPAAQVVAWAGGAARPTAMTTTEARNSDRVETP